MHPQVSPLLFLQLASVTHMDREELSCSSPVWLSQSSGGRPSPLGPSWGSDVSGGLLVPDAIAVVTSWVELLSDIDASIAAA